VRKHGLHHPQQHVNGCVVRQTVNCCLKKTLLWKMMKKRTSSAAAQQPLHPPLCLADLPHSWCQQLLCCLSAASRLALRATCKHFLHICDTPIDTNSVQQAPQLPSPQDSSRDQAAEQQQRQHGSQLALTRPCQSQLVLKLTRRQPTLAHLHQLGLLQQLVVLDTAGASRGVLRVGTTTAAAMAGKWGPADVFIRIMPHGGRRFHQQHAGWKHPSVSLSSCMCVSCSSILLSTTPTSLSSC
jgi:hypothetical protein